jgi:Cu(I)-responsive transcriptional regulator
MQCFYKPCSNYKVKPMGTTLSIGELGRITRTSPETIRYYEKIGLLKAAARSSGNYRCYGEPHLARLSFVRRARELGFSIEQVRTLLDLADHRERDCHTVDALAQEHLTTIERKIADLTALKRQLTSLLNSCRGGKVADCQIIGALAPIGPAGGNKKGGLRPRAPG